MKWLIVGTLFFAAFPSTSNYNLNSYSFGSGGGANSTTSNYALEGVSGELNGQTTSTANNVIKPGFTETQQANVPTIQTFDNGSNTYYNKLHFVINTQANPTDALYALSISTDNFASDTRYVKSDLTVGNTLSLTDYKTYAAWGGASGANIIGLLPSTTYQLRVKATQGKFTESQYGSSSSASTVSPQLTFSISTNSVSFGSLLPSTVTNGGQTITVSFATNAESGGDVYINGQNTGLLSTRTGFTIASATGDLTSLNRGFGAQVTGTSASSGTFSSVSPYNGSSNNVGLTDTVIRKILTSTGPIAGGSGIIQLKAKATSTDPAAPDYSETLTMLASASF